MAQRMANDLIQLQLMASSQEKVMKKQRMRVKKAMLALMERELGPMSAARKAAGDRRDLLVASPVDPEVNCWRVDLFLLDGKSGLSRSISLTRLPPS